MRVSDSMLTACKPPAPFTSLLMLECHFAEALWVPCPAKLLQSVSSGMMMHASRLIPVALLVGTVCALHRSVACIVCILIQGRIQEHDKRDKPHLAQTAYQKVPCLTSRGVDRFPCNGSQEDLRQGCDLPAPSLPVGVPFLPRIPQGAHLPAARLRVPMSSCPLPRFQLGLLAPANASFRLG